MRRRLRRSKWRRMRENLRERSRKRISPRQDARAPLQYRPLVVALLQKLTGTLSSPGEMGSRADAATRCERVRTCRRGRAMPASFFKSFRAETRGELRFSLGPLALASQEIHDSIPSQSARAPVSARKLAAYLRLTWAPCALAGQNPRFHPAPGYEGHQGFRAETGGLPSILAGPFRSRGSKSKIRYRPDCKGFGFRAETG